MQGKLNPDKILVPGSRILVSACLLGVECNYKSEASSAWQKRPDFFTELMKNFIVIPVCPEQLGGLSTPRTPAELKGSAADVINGFASVINRSGEDVTAYFLKGAQEALRIARFMGVDVAVFKTRSPSCSNKLVYDGTFSGTLVNGMGLTAHLLEKSGIKIFNEDDFF